MLLLALLVSCGGGGGTSSSNTEPPPTLSISAISFADADLAVQYSPGIHAYDLYIRKTQDSITLSPTASVPDTSIDINSTQAQPGSAATIPITGHTTALTVTLTRAKSSTVTYQFRLKRYEVVDGYTDKVSYSHGQEQRVMLNSDAEAAIAKLRLYDVHGNVVQTVKAPVKPQQTASSTPWQDGFGYEPTFTYTIPQDLPSGAYYWEQKALFIVRGSPDSSDIVVLYPSNTLNAYSTEGGKSLYEPTLASRAHIVSFERPTPEQINHDPLPCLSWFKDQQGYAFRYIADSDMDDYAHIENARVLVIIGHSEYWTRKARENFDRFVQGGGHAVILSGNTMWWQVRYSAEGSKMTCYKDATLDPIADPRLETIKWHETDYPALPSIGAVYNLSGNGTGDAIGWDGFKIATPTHPFFEGLNLSRGDVVSLLSSEYDSAPIIGTDAQGYPIIDRAQLGFEHIELLGYDIARVGASRQTFATFIVFQKSATSGIVVNGASTNWCGATGFGGPDGAKIKRITKNILDTLLSSQPLWN